MERICTDIVIAGGGVAGLSAAAVMARAGFSVTCIEPNPQVTQQGTGADLRSTAFWAPSVALLSEVGIWDRLASHASPLSVMRIADAGGPENRIRETADFTAAELDRDTFGYNLPNWVIRRELVRHLDADPRVRLLTGVSVTQVLARTTQMLVTLSDGTQHGCALAIAADGRDSFLREASGIAARRWAYGQKALVLAVRHARPHDGISTEIHRTGGPFTLVPLPDHDGAPHSAVVWMETGPRADALHQMDDADFTAALNERSCGVLGPLSPASHRGIWPIISLLAERLDAPRTALIAEAAHVVPPIGAQGLNMSLADLRALRDLIAGATDPGSPDLLTRYHRTRWPDLAARVAGIDALNRAAMADAPILRDLRRTTLRSLAGLEPIKKSLMRGGMGAGFTMAPADVPR